MYYAPGGEKRLVDVMVDSYEFLENISTDPDVLKCPYCNTRVDFINGKKKDPHFSHRDSSQHNLKVKSESKDHRETKSFLFEHIKEKQNNLKKLPNGNFAIRKEHSLHYDGLQKEDPLSFMCIPDIFLVLQNGKQIAIEYQRYRITPEQLDRKIYTYKRNGISPIYFFGGSLYIPRVNEPSVRGIGDLERKVMELWDGFYYMYCPDEKSINRNIYKISLGSTEPQGIVLQLQMNQVK